MSKWVKITAIVRPHRLDPICDALIAAAVPGVTVTDVEGVGQQLGYSTLRSGVWYQSKSHPKVQLDAVVPATQLDEVLALLREHAHTGEAGDGKMWWTPVDAGFHIRDGLPLAPD